MKFYSISLLIALIGNAKANPEPGAETPRPCLAKCEVVDGEKECVFEVSRDELASELGYFEYRGADGDCGGTNPTLGIEKGVTYRFTQRRTSNYYHPLGFAYGADGALDNQPELEPGIVPPGSTSDCADNDDLSCPGPMYVLDDQYLGVYSNNEVIAPVNSASDDFGLDAYEPQFFRPLLEWKTAGLYQVTLKFDVLDFTQDFFYFCHIHQFMSGRVKFVDANGDALNPVNTPALPYSYDQPDAYDRSCGTTGITEFQLPNPECPKKFVCDKPDEKPTVKKFAECVDTMNCAMISGMTTNVNKDSAIALFNHQMIPHHQQAVNMCKALIISGEIECDDIVELEDEPTCILKVLCQEIINVQNFQIQTMRGVLDALDLDPEDDCVVPIDSKKVTKSDKKNKAAKKTKR